MISLNNGKYLGSNKLCYDGGGVFLTETEYQNRVFEGWHSHENVHISLIVKGGNREKRKYGDMDVLPGTVLFYHQNELHRNLHTIHPSKNINLEISSEFMQEYEIEENEIEKMSRHFDAGFSIIKMYNEARQADHFSKPSIQMSLLELIADIRKLPNKRPFWMETIIEFLQDNWQGHPSLDELAQLANVNSITVSKHFSKYMGCTLGEYMRKLKVQHAQKLIHRSNLSLTEIAYKCGFSDQSHFIRNFREQTNFLPKAYQKL